ncbi:MAG: DUF1343 domain-containing protein [bacterium]
MSKMMTGLDVVREEGLGSFRGARVGLVMNQASVDSRFRSAADVVAGSGGLRLRALFGPQHGIFGQTQDNMVEWEGFDDAGTGVPVHSLYGAVRKPTVEMLEGLDAVMVDLQDVGTRVYTFASTLFLVMEACAEKGIGVVVLDRPNPIGGVAVEGNVLEEGFRSFVGMMRIPMRHGMTMGELALMYRETAGLACHAEVVKMRGWRREWCCDETGLPWVMPSPNMPTVETAAVYPGAVLFEGTNVSEGRGTTKPFELIGAPWIDGGVLAGALNAAGMGGVYFREARFEPTFGKCKGLLCGGIQAHVTDRREFKPYRTGLAVLREIMRRWRDVFEWKEPPYEYERERMPIDIIAGTDAVRLALESDRGIGEIEEDGGAAMREFMELRRRFLLY